MLRKGSVLWLIWNILVAAIFVTLGIVSCVNAGDTDFQNVVILIIGIFVIVDATFRLLFQVLRIFVGKNITIVAADYAQAAVASSELAIGIVLILASQEMAALEALFKYLSLFIGILLVTVGAIAILFSIILIVKKARSMLLNILTILGGAIGITAGILVMVYLGNQNNFLQVFFIVVGIFLIVIGALVAFLTVLGVIETKRQAKENKTEAVAEVKEDSAEEPKIEAVEAEPEEKPEEKPEDKPEEE